MKKLSVSTLNRFLGRKDKFTYCISVWRGLQSIVYDDGMRPYFDAYYEAMEPTKQQGKGLFT